MLTVIVTASQATYPSTAAINAKLVKRAIYMLSSVLASCFCVIVALSYTSKGACSRYFQHIRKVDMRFVLSLGARLQRTRTSLPLLCLAIWDRMIDNEHLDQVEIAARKVPKRSTTQLRREDWLGRQYISSPLKFLPAILQAIFLSNEGHEHPTSASNI